jgi:hypothetical protein
MFYGPGHAAKFWLPHFWGLDPWEYGLFLRLATVSRSLEDNLERQQARYKLAHRSWSWLNGRTLWHAIEINRPQRSPMTAADRVSNGLRILCEIIDQAKREREKTKYDENTVKALDPRVAIQRTLYRLRTRYP